MSKNRLVTRLVTPLAVFALNLAIAKAPAQTLGTRVHVTGGEIEGVASSVPGVTEFKGIPYAAPGRSITLATAATARQVERCLGG